MDCWGRTPGWGVSGRHDDPAYGHSPQESLAPQGHAYYDHDTNKYHGHYYQRSAGVQCRPHWALMLMLMLISMPWNMHARRHPRFRVQGPIAPDTLTQDHSTYVTKNAYGNLRNTHVDINTIREQPKAAKAARKLRILTMNVTSWSSKIYRYVLSLPYDVIFFQEHRKTLPRQIKVPKGFRLAFPPPRVQAPN